MSLWSRASVYPINTRPARIRALNSYRPSSDTIIHDLGRRVHNIGAEEQVLAHHPPHWQRPWGFSHTGQLEGESSLPTNRIGRGYRTRRVVPASMEGSMEWVEPGTALGGRRRKASRRSRKASRRTRKGRR
jgi:hypothetical protein